MLKIATTGIVDNARDKKKNNKHQPIHNWHRKGRRAGSADHKDRELHNLHTIGEVAMISRESPQ